MDKTDHKNTLVRGRACGNFSLARHQKPVARGAGLSDLIIPARINTCFLLWMKLFEMGSTLKQKNLLQEEQIPSFKSDPISIEKGAKRWELYPFRVFLFPILCIKGFMAVACYYNLGSKECSPPNAPVAYYRINTVYVTTYTSLWLGFIQGIAVYQDLTTKKFKAVHLGAII